MNTQENKLIAEFMGLETPDGCYFEYITKEGERSKATHFILLEYHTSWDWLMPVVDKIESIDIEGRCYTIAIEFDEATVWEFTPYEDAKRKINAFSYTKREATYKAVVEFINQYNKNESID